MVICMYDICYPSIGCGACTVMISQLNSNGIVEHRSVNACLAPLCSVDGCAVVTVEGIGSTRAGLHPVQERIAALHGSQCGFCTPGIVMALYTFLRNNPSPTKEEIEESFDGKGSLLLSMCLYVCMQVIYADVRVTDRFSTPPRRLLLTIRKMAAVEDEELMAVAAVT